MAEKHEPDYNKICELISSLGFIHCQITHDDQNLGEHVNQWQATIQNLIDALNAMQGPLCYYYEVDQLQKHYNYVNCDVTWKCIKQNIKQYTLDIYNELWELSFALQGEILPESQSTKKYLKRNPSTWFIN